MAHSPTLSFCVYAEEPRLDSIDEFLSVLRGQKLEKYEILLAIPDVAPRELRNALQQADSRIRLVDVVSGGNRWHTYNLLLKHARGDFVKFSRPSEAWPVNFLSKMLQSFESRPNTILAVSKNSSFEAALSAQCISEHAEGSTSENFRRDQLFLGQSAISIAFRDLVNWIGCIEAGLFRRDGHTASFDEKFQFLAELDFWFQLLSHGNMFSVDELFSFRVRERSAEASVSIRALLEYPALAFKHGHYLELLGLTASEYCLRALSKAQSRSGPSANLLTTLSEFAQALEKPSFREDSAEWSGLSLRTTHLSAYGLIAHAALPQLQLKQERLAEMQQKQAELEQACQTLALEKQELYEISERRQSELLLITQSRFWKTTDLLRRLLRRIVLVGSGSRESVSS